MIVGSPDESIILQRLDELERSLKREINYRLYSSVDYVRDIQGAEPFIINILADRKIFLIGDDNELRKMVEGSPDQETGSGS